MYLSIVVPCYNEEESLPMLLERIFGMAQSANLAEKGFELVLIDDGSTDRTWDIMNSSVSKHPELVLVRLSRNHGHQLALSAGLSQVSGSRILVIDADLQDPPELYPEMQALMDEQNADVVYGKRTKRAGESFLKRASASLFYRQLRKSTNIDLPLDTGDFRLMSRRVSDLLVSMPEKDRFIRGMVSWVGFKQIPFEYSRDVRFAGVTKYPLKKMLQLASDAFMGFSMLPLRLAGRAAAIVSLMTIGFVLYAIYSWIFLDVVAGWASLVILISFLSSVQLCILAILGEYVGRIYLEAKNRPLFLIDSVVRHPKGA